jgi:hypothetical protein
VLARSTASLQPGLKCRSRCLLNLMMVIGYTHGSVLKTPSNHSAFRVSWVNSAEMYRDLAVEQSRDRVNCGIESMNRRSLPTFSLHRFERLLRVGFDPSHIGQNRTNAFPESGHSNLQNRTLPGVRVHSVSKE